MDVVDAGQLLAQAVLKILCVHVANEILKLDANRCGVILVGTDRATVVKAIIVVQSLLFRNQKSRNAGEHMA